MNYKSLHDYIKDTVLGLHYSTTFFHGRVVPAQQVIEKDTFFIWLEPIPSNISFTNNQFIDKTYTLTMAVTMKDSLDSAINRNQIASQESKEVKILEQTDFVTNDLLRKLSDNDINTTLQYMSDLITLSNVSVNPLIKATNSNLTGMAITFNIQVPDQFNYCCD